ncbi:MAG: hypothetical protein U5J83_04860 [Bryobacterales bacterium]|nr:hypothetical protein [Bryobacterales bacterium]
MNFPLNWMIRLIHYGAVAAMFGYMVHTAITGDPEKDMSKVLLGCAGVLIALVLLPGSILLDSRGIHQVYAMGLYEYTIPKNSILSYRQSTREELRREGVLWFSWAHSKADRDGTFEQVVIVRSRYGKRYILHTPSHSRQYSFVEELEKRGVPAHGYEGWNQFMTERGFPPSETKL